MDIKLKNKIIELYTSGNKTFAKIIAELSRPTSVSSQQPFDRPYYLLEIDLKDKVIPDIISPAELPVFMPLSGTEKEIMVKQKIQQKVDTSLTVDEKINWVNLGLQLQNSRIILDRLGSLIFSDPYFCQPSGMTEINTETGPSFLEENGLTAPTDAEIKLVIVKYLDSLKPIQDEPIVDP